MVPLRKLRHFAPQTVPERENRLLAFAKATDGATSAEWDDGTQEPLPTSDSPATPDIQGNTRTALDEAMQNPGATHEQKNDTTVQKTPEEILIDGNLELRANGNHLLAIMRGDKNKTIEQVRAMGQNSFTKRWTEDLEELEEQMHRSQGDTSLVEGVQKLKDGEHPDKCIASLEDWAHGEGYGFKEYFQRVTDVVKAVRGEHAEKIARWDTLNRSDKIEINKDILEAAAMKELIQRMIAMHSDINSAIKDLQQPYTDAALELKKNANLTKQHGIMDTLRKIRFYSLNDIAHGLKEYWEALHNSWEHTRHTKSAAIAASVGKAMEWLPFYGKETALQLNQNIRAKNREKTGKEKERLKESNANWRVLFGQDGHAGLLHDYLHGSNYDNARAVLEYAASRGWLYDLDESMSTSVKTVYGYPLSEICTDWNAEEVANYFTSLRQQNSGGRNDEVENAKKKIEDNRNVPLFISEIERELDDLNIWAAAGICKRAMERGLWGEIAPWLTTTVLGKLRDSPMLRSITNDYFFDIVGKMSMYTTSPTLGWFKANGRDLSTWCQQNSEGHFEGTQVGKIIMQVERRVFERCTDKPREYFETPEGKKKMRHWSAKILAGQTVEVSPGKFISIFESEYEWYRLEMTHTFASPAKPYEEDSDYYITESEQWLTPENVFKKILAHQSTGEFHKEDFAKPFITKLINKAKELRDKPQLAEAYKNYMHETRTKLDLWMSGLRSHAAGARIATTVLSDNQTPAIAALYYNGLISKNVIMSAPQIWKIVEEEQMTNEIVFPPGKAHIHDPPIMRPGPDAPASGQTVPTTQAV